MRSPFAILISGIFFQSCAAYQEITVSLPDATQKGNVKIVDAQKKKHYFENIIQIDSSYFGMGNDTEKRGAFRYIRIPQQEVSKVYLRKPRVYRTWINPNDGKKIQHGILVKVKDSSIVVSSTGIFNDAASQVIFKNSENDTALANQYRLREYSIKDIKDIKTRRLNAVGNGVLFGVLAGVSFGYFASPKGDIEEIAGPALLGIFALPVGAFIGSSRIKIPINGNLSTFNKNRFELHPIIKSGCHDCTQHELIPADPVRTRKESWNAYVPKNEEANKPRDPSEVLIQNAVFRSFLIPITILIWGGLLNIW